VARHGSGQNVYLSSSNIRNEQHPPERLCPQTALPIRGGGAARAATVRPAAPPLSLRPLPAISPDQPDEGEVAAALRRNGRLTAFDPVSAEQRARKRKLDAILPALSLPLRHRRSWPSSIRAAQPSRTPSFRCLPLQMPDSSGRPP